MRVKTNRKKRMESELTKKSNKGKEKRNERKGKKNVNDNFPQTQKEIKRERKKRNCPPNKKLTKRRRKVKRNSRLVRQQNERTHAHTNTRTNDSPPLIGCQESNHGEREEQIYLSKSCSRRPFCCDRHSLLPPASEKARGCEGGGGGLVQV